MSFTDQNFRRELSSIPGFNPELTHHLIDLYKEYGIVIHPYFYVYVYMKLWNRNDNNDFTYEMTDLWCREGKSVDDVVRFVANTYLNFVASVWPGMDFKDDVDRLSEYIRRQIDRTDPGIYPHDFDYGELVYDAFEYIIETSPTIERVFGLSSENVLGYQRIAVGLSDDE